MFELGEESLSEHKKIIELLISETNIKTYFIGKYFYANQVQNSHINPLVKTSSLSLLEYSFIDDDIELILNDYCFLNNCMLKKSELNNVNNNDQLRFEIPANICMHTIFIKLNDQLEEYVTIFFNKNDDSWLLCSE